MHWVLENSTTGFWLPNHDTRTLVHETLASHLNRLAKSYDQDSETEIPSGLTNSQITSPSSVQPLMEPLLLSRNPEVNVVSVGLIMLWPVAQVFAHL